MSIALYQIEFRIQEILNKIAEDGGEITSETESQLDLLEQEKLVKVQNIGLYVKNLTATIEAIRQEEKNLADRRKSLEKKAEWLKGYLSQFLGEEKVELPNIVISFRKSESVEIGPFANLEKLHEHHPVLVKKEVTFKPDKKQIKEFLKAGNVKLEDIKIVEKRDFQIK